MPVFTASLLATVSSRFKTAERRGLDLGRREHDLKVPQSTSMLLEARPTGAVRDPALLKGPNVEEEGALNSNNLAVKRD